MLPAAAPDSFSSLQAPEKNLRLYRLYNIYRVCLGLALSYVALIPAESSLFSNAGLGSTLLFCLIYTGLPFWDLLITHKQPGLTHVLIVTCLDIILLSVLLIMGEVSDNSLTNLLFIPIALGNALIQGRLGILLAAVATLCLLSIHYRQEFSSEIYDQLDAGLKGFLFFCWALMIQSYNFRLRNTEVQALLNQSQAVDLQQLSQSIIQHMRTGILVLKEPDNVIMMNQAGAEILASSLTQGKLHQISSTLLEVYRRWQFNPALKVESFQAEGHNQNIQPEFTHLHFQSSSYVLIFLEDKASLNQQAQKLKLASLGQLTASIAHEVRNPLGAISHSAQLLAETNALPESDGQLVQIINKHCHRINDIIETVLQISRREYWHPEVIDLNGWLKQFIGEEHFNGFPEPSIIFDSEQENLHTCFDRRHLCQAMTNLCINGLRYSQQNTGSATLRISSGSTESGHPCLEITDQGPGIPEDQRNEIFNPFYTTEIQGTGLGLFLSKELCEINGANLELLEPQNEQGCTFRISFALPDRNSAGI
ncbi:ATP-binding protein [Sansalvadorimonas sp. 2012CJ34-2]|uniref:histidine kinase n=1 Tax=Parendozoicomonas callyspongiae TaxID=2942213 RepID=A0ABT0PDN3_9GAMM|nr:ATP-binding protein [Sansalvadorimonas sp. 2012CJ34-2]MCL6269492.1 ATP-binding protein [Sansalvadorimonas sp. 2012CJ34-2]